MKKVFLLVWSLWAGVVPAQENKTLPLIPQPLSETLTQGFFVLNSGVMILNASFSPEYSDGLFRQDAVTFNMQLKKLAGYELAMNEKEVAVPEVTRPAIILICDFDNFDEGEYILRITPSQVTISGGKSGVFYGLQSLLQLAGSIPEAEKKIPCCIIRDRPRYSWRGMHLDCSRHFFTKQEVEKYIDYLALYKFNVFHWHLCDDQGWRIEIKKYPLLTSMGSQRKETMIGKPVKDQKFDGKPYGGFYTQDDIKEIIAYASMNHITVVPEIEMPGHSLAALAAYPQYSCTGGPFEVGTRWGVFDDVYCAGNDSTFVFLENILSEVCDLFPGKYIHIGGDECPKERWEKCPKCQQRIKDEKLKDEHELQSYFVQRMEKFLNGKGKQMIGWDEILEGGLAPNATVMSWRGTAGGIDAAKQHHDVVMTPGNPCYFDHYQAKDKKSEPLAIGGFNPLDSVYAYEPAPRELNEEEKKFVLGAQGNVWTEYITTFQQVEYMSIPRMCALSEALWTDPKNKNYKDFIERLKLHKVMLDQLKINYAKHFLTP